MHASPKSLIFSTKKDTEKDCVSQWLSTSRNSIISFKDPIIYHFYNYSLGKSDIQTVIQTDILSLTNSLFSSLDSQEIIALRGVRGIFFRGGKGYFF